MTELFLERLEVCTSAQHLFQASLSEFSHFASLVLFESFSHKKIITFSECKAPPLGSVLACDGGSVFCTHLFVHDILHSNHPMIQVAQ